MVSGARVRKLRFWQQYRHRLGRAANRCEAVLLMCIRPCGFSYRRDFQDDLRHVKSGGWRGELGAGQGAPARKSFAARWSVSRDLEQKTFRGTMLTRFSGETVGNLP
jgi:hypothetical protein